MMRALHRWPGLFALLLLIVLALSGSVLSVFPAAERLRAPQAEAGLSVAELGARVKAAYPGVEQVKRAPSGQITAYWFDNGVAHSAKIDPSTGRGVASADPNGVQLWLTTLHRSLFLDDGGRVVMAAGAAAMLVLALSGILMVARRAGGWRRWFAPLKGPLSGRLHVEIARIAVLGLALSSATALWMTASTFDLLPDRPAALRMPGDVSGQTGVALTSIDAFARTPVSALRELSFPAMDDSTDVLTLKTDEGAGYIDQGTGKVLAWNALGPWERVTETTYMLHTGQGASVLGLLLGLLALGVPVMGVTGTIMWIAGRRGRPRLRGNVPASAARTVLLVGSEGGSTWGFAATLHKALTAAGDAVHAAPMSAFDPDRYLQAGRIIVLTATYGDGGAPASGAGFLDRLAQMRRAPAAPLAVLGFGDSSFHQFCGFAREVSDAAAARGWHQFLGLGTVDRQSSQDFARWGRALGDAMGIPLEIVHHPVRPNTQLLTLVSRRDYGAEVQAPTAVLRFALPRTSLWRRLMGAGFGRFQPGDLLGILPQGSDVPRVYSLASGRRDGFIEIAVRKHAGGLCSSQLMALEPGEAIAAFHRPNAAFRPGRGRAPLVLIGAGTGIGPLAGFIRANDTRRPVHLFFGLRHPDSDFLYDEDLARWQREGRLSRIVTANSRGRHPHYVQDALRGEAAQLAWLIRSGAMVMVCGGRGMAKGVADALAEILAPLGLTPAMLKAQGRYVEDAY